MKYKNMFCLALAVFAFNVTLVNSASAGDNPAKSIIHNAIDVAYDSHGYNRHGYNRHGYNRHGYNQHGYNRHGYNRHGYNRRGRNRHGRYNSRYHRRSH